MARRFAARIREDYAMNSRLLIPLLLLPLACGPKEPPAARLRRAADHGGGGAVARPGPRWWWRW